MAKIGERKTWYLDCGKNRFSVLTVKTKQGAKLVDKGLRVS